mgnify:CR=1 FL=1
MADKNFVSSLDKGLQVLGCLGRQHARLTVSEAARLTGSTPASARRSLLTLQALGYLDSDGKRFWMLPKALLIAHAYLASRATPTLAQPLLDALKATQDHAVEKLKVNSTPTFFVQVFVQAK